MLDGSYSISDIQDYFEYILKKHSENVDNPSIRIYVNKIENRFTFKTKNGYYLELLASETMKLLGSTESKITKDKYGENGSHSDIVELVLVHCNLVNNDYLQDSRILYTFVPNKPFVSLLEISPTNHIFLKTFNSEFQENELWFTDQTSKPLEVEDKINLTLIIKQYGYYKKCVIQLNLEIERMEKAMDFYLLLKILASSKYSQKHVDSAKKSASDAIKTASKRAIQKTAEATGDLIGNKIADKITSVSTELHSKKSPRELHSKEFSSNEANNEIPK